MNIKTLLPALIIFSTEAVFSQEAGVYNWWNPANNDFPVIEGQAWTKETKDPFDRLPARSESTVRNAVWELSHNTAGLLIRFKTNSSQVIIRYQVSGELALPHMPSTGVSGVDLFALNSNNNWLWCAGKYTFGDTIQYRFTGLDTTGIAKNKSLEYWLYLPLYNSVRWLEIAVQPMSLFMPLPVRTEKPIVVYGTSIAQGCCASRPGMAWTSIVGRKSGTPLINLGFSGNGKLEKEIIDLLSEVNAKLYVLDCLPNLTAPNTSPQETKKRIIASVNQLRQKRKGIPILLVEHGGYTDGLINKGRREAYTAINQVMKKAFEELKANGLKNIFLLTKQEINLDIDCMVDGTHPTDYGMLLYAKAYEKKIREILQIF